MAELTPLLEQLLSPDNAIRSAAEEHLTNTVRTNPQPLLTKLMETLQSGARNEVSESLHTTNPFCKITEISNTGGKQKNPNKF
jgi:hypothetical protein